MKQTSCDRGLPGGREVTSYGLDPSLVVALTLAVMVLAVVTGCNNEGDIEADISNTPISERISALDMHELYEADEEAARQRFYGKVVEVTGTVESKGTLFTYDNDEFTLAGLVELAGGVECSFSPEHGERTDSHSRGDSVVLLGRVDDFDLDTGELRLRGCSFVE